MTDKEKIRAEIERRMKGKCPIVCSYIIYEDILNFIDSMQEEPKFKTGDRIKPIDSCLGSPRTIVDVCDSWYVTDQGTLDFVYEDNWELAEKHKKCMYSKDNYTNEDRKVLCDGCEEECKYNKKEPSIPDIVDEHFYEMLGEEPMSEDLEEALAKEWKGYVDRGAATVDALEDNTQELTFAKGFYRGAKWQKAKNESTTKDLGEYINELSKQFPEVSFAKLSRIAVRVAKWQKEQIKKAMDLGEPPYLISVEQAYYRTLKLLED